MQKDNQTIIVYLVYGHEKVFRQAAFSILSLYNQVDKRLDDLQIVVYTDNEDLLRKYVDGFCVVIERLSTELLATWKGESNFNHRTKICMLKDCLSKYNSKTLYLDTDTVFLQSPFNIVGEISRETIVMHKNEFDLYEAGGYEDINWLLMRRLLKNNSFDLNGSTFQIDFSVRMWNSGVIGISPENCYLLENALSLCDQFYKKEKVFLAEQFAFSYIFQINRRLIESDDCIFHYWSQKGLFDQHLEVFFKTNGQYSLAVRRGKVQEFMNSWSTLKPIDPPRLITAMKRIKSGMKYMIFGRLY
jgi:hypothetical protein